jgi:hypothetical protein
MWPTLTSPSGLRRFRAALDKGLLNRPISYRGSAILGENDGAASSAVGNTAAAGRSAAGFGAWAPHLIIIAFAYNDC